MEPVHPGEVIKHEVLDPLGMSVSKLAIELRVPVTRISEIVHGPAWHYGRHVATVGSLFGNFFSFLAKPSDRL